MELSPRRFRSLEEENSDLSALLDAEMAPTPPGEQSSRYGTSTESGESGVSQGESDGQEEGYNLYGYDDEDGYAPYWNDSTHLTDGTKWPDNGVAL